MPTAASQHSAEAVSIAAGPDGLPQDTSANGQPLEQQELSPQDVPQGTAPGQQGTLPQPTPLDATALQQQALAAQQALAMQAAQATAAAIAAAASQQQQQQQQRAQVDGGAEEAPEENGESEEEGDEGGDTDDDDDYSAKVSCRLVAYVCRLPWP